MSHSILEDFDGSTSCSCGLYFPPFDQWGAVDHALPISARELADAVKAEPGAAPERIASAETLAQQAAAVCARAEKMRGQ